VVAGKEIFDRTLIDGNDPSDNAQVWYQYAVAKKSDLDLAVSTAKKALPAWDQLGAQSRADILKEFGQIAHSQM